MNSKVADMQNISGPGAGAGSITAAVFLERFVNDTPWAHLDIAAVSGQEASSPHIVTGFGVRLAVDFIENNYQKRLSVLLLLSFTTTYLVFVAYRRRSNSSPTPQAKLRQPNPQHIS